MVDLLISYPRSPTSELSAQSALGSVMFWNAARAA